ncbi:hypothetical protein RJZ56_006525 [Blastomyces dermatitidis]
MLCVREAIATARPYSTGIIAHADSFQYNQGVLCDMRQGFLRVLDVHVVAAEKLVIDVEMAFLLHLKESEDERTMNRENFGYLAL